MYIGEIMQDHQRTTNDIQIFDERKVTHESNLSKT
jgi:hypothetical protein